jgi:hypothetical protein
MRTRRDRSADICPHCGGRVFHRFGEYFPPLIAEIFDAILDFTIRRGSIEMESLCVMFYGGIEYNAARNRMRVNINHINNLLASTDVRVISKRSGNGNGHKIESGYKAIGFTVEEIKRDRPWISYDPPKSRTVRSRLNAARDRRARKAGL